MTFPIVDQAEALAARGRIGEALRLLQPAAERGDGDALFALATWRLSGEHLPRDLAQARQLYARAAQAGRSDALDIYLAFVANGTGGRADWREARRLLHAFAAVNGALRGQRDLIEAMRLTEDGAPCALPAGDRLSDLPDVTLFRGLFTPAECDFLVRAGEPMLASAMVVDPRTGRLVRDPVRTSETAAFPLALESPAIHALNRRIAATSGTHVTQGEPLQLLSYRPGQQYHPHLDALPTGDNQRILTMLVYLNEGFEGGETQFLPGGPSIRGATGDAILFRNVDAAGRPDPASRHAGLPVTSGRKLLASRRIRARPLDLGDRPGSS